MVREPTFVPCHLKSARTRFVHACALGVCERATTRHGAQLSIRKARVSGHSAPATHLRHRGGTRDLVARSFGEPPFEGDLDSERDWKAAANYDAPAPSAVSPCFPLLDWQVPSLRAAEERWLAEEVRLWLDREWEPLAAHREIGEKAAKAALDARIALEGSGGTAKFGEVLITVASELERGPNHQVGRDSWREAYVNPFDVANKVSDLYMVRYFVETELTAPAEDESDATDIDSSWTALPLSDTCRCTGLDYEDILAIQKRARDLGLSVGRIAYDKSRLGGQAQVRKNRTDTGASPTGSSVYERSYAADQVDKTIQSFDDVMYRERVLYEALRTKRLVQERGLYGDFALGCNEEYVKAAFPSDKIWGWDPDPHQQSDARPPSMPIESTPFDGIVGSIRDVHPFDRHVFFMGALYGDIPSVVVNRVVSETARLANHTMLLHHDFDVEALLRGVDGTDAIVDQLNGLSVEVAFRALRPAPAAATSHDDSAAAEAHMAGTQSDAGTHAADADADAELRMQIQRDLDLLIETLYGEVAAQVALQEKDRSFRVRSAIVRYLAAFTWGTP
jgi:hypothetical protein